MLQVENISVYYGKMPAVQDLSFKVEPGKFVSILGANGAGKTTTLKSLMGLVPIRTGRILFDGKDIRSWSSAERIRAGISLVPEGRQVFPGLSVEENLELAYFVSHPGKRDYGHYKKLLEKMYDFFPRLRERLQQKAGSLSGGEQQMLVIARGLLAEPKLFMLDEPSLGLAPIIIDLVFDVLTKLNKEGLTVIIVEQDAYRALSVSHESHIIESGRLTHSGSSKELLESQTVQTAIFGN